MTRPIIFARLQVHREGRGCPAAGPKRDIHTYITYIYIYKHIYIYIYIYNSRGRLVVRTLAQVAKVPGLIPADVS